MLILQWHCGGKGTLPRHPTYVNALCGITPSTGGIKGLVTKRFQHLVQFALCARPWTICDNADDSGQFLFSWIDSALN